MSDDDEVLPEPTYVNINKKEYQLFYTDDFIYLVPLDKLGYVTGFYIQEPNKSTLDDIFDDIVANQKLTRFRQSWLAQSESGDNYLKELTATAEEVAQIENNDGDIEDPRKDIEDRHNLEPAGFSNYDELKTAPKLSTADHKFAMKMWYGSYEPYILVVKK